jgi:hypothetical protein
MSWPAEHDAEFRAVVDAPVLEHATNGDHHHAHGLDDDRVSRAAGAASSWGPLDLGPIVAGVQAGEIVGPLPQLMARTDGVCLLYPGEVHSLAGEPESGKGWAALHAASVGIERGEGVLYIDFEDAPASIVGRSLALGAEPGGIIEHFTYVRPVDPFDPATFLALIESRYALAVIDGLSEAFVLLDLDPYSNVDAARFLSTIARPIAETGAAVLLIDHVVKSKETRGRYAIGAQHKLAGIAAAYSTEVIKAPSRTDDGLIKIRVEKDRHGHVRGHAQSGVITLMHIKPEAGGERVTVTLEPPETTVSAGEFRPTTLMERLSKFLEAEPGAGLNTIRRGVQGKTEYVDQALRILVAEGFVRVQVDGQTKRHFVDLEYREDTDRDPATQPRPNRDPVAGDPNRDPATPPYKGGAVAGHGDGSQGETSTATQGAVT